MWRTGASCSNCRCEPRTPFCGHRNSVRRQVPSVPQTQFCGYAGCVHDKVPNSDLTIMPSGWTEEASPTQGPLWEPAAQNTEHSLSRGDCSRFCKTTAARGRLEQAFLTAGPCPRTPFCGHRKNHSMPCAALCHELHSAATVAACMAPFLKRNACRVVGPRKHRACGA